MSTETLGIKRLVQRVLRDSNSQDRFRDDDANLALLSLITDNSQAFSTMTDQIFNLSEQTLGKDINPAMEELNRAQSDVQGNLLVAI